MSVSVESSVLLMIETQMCLEFLLHANKTPNDRQQQAVHICFFLLRYFLAGHIVFLSFLEVMFDI